MCPNPLPGTAVGLVLQQDAAAQSAPSAGAGWIQSRYCAREPGVSQDTWPKGDKMTSTHNFSRADHSHEAFPIPPFGFEGGYGTEGDALPRVTETADGTDLNRVWDDFQRTLEEWNNSASSLAGLLSYWHTNVADSIPKGFNRNTFERASNSVSPKRYGPVAMNWSATTSRTTTGQHASPGKHCETWMPARFAQATTRRSTKTVAWSPALSCGGCSTLSPRPTKVLRRSMACTTLTAWSPRLLPAKPSTELTATTSPPVPPPSTAATWNPPSSW